MRVLRTIALLSLSVIGSALAAARILPSSRKASAVDVPAVPYKAGWKQRVPVLARHFALFVAIIVVGGFLVSASGIVSIKASSGHWAITRWFLSFSSQRSIATHTLGETTPTLDEPWLVLKGAGHYETGCRPCHGSPVQPRPRIALEMTPPPPRLPPVISKWDPDELFYIVKHGIKFTGMPAWPSLERDDEVWAMTAFLLALPDMDAEEYERLVHGDNPRPGQNAPIHDLLGPEEAPRAVTESCARCHGVRGLGRGTDAFPRIAGQSPTYLYAALQAYAKGERHSGIMEPIAAGLSVDGMRELALYYGSQANTSLLPAHDPSTPDTSNLELGRTIALEGIPSAGIPSCRDCHGPDAGPRNPFYPSLAGQYADYIELQLDLFKNRKRGGSAYAHLMYPIADQLTPEQVRAVASYYASLTSGLDSLVQSNEHIAKR